MENVSIELGADGLESMNDKRQEYHHFRNLASSTVRGDVNKFKKWVPVVETDQFHQSRVNAMMTQRSGFPRVDMSSHGGEKEERREADIHPRFKKVNTVLLEPISREAYKQNNQYSAVSISKVFELPDQNSKVVRRKRISKKSNASDQNELEMLTHSLIVGKVTSNVSREKESVNAALEKLHNSINTMTKLNEHGSSTPGIGRVKSKRQSRNNTAKIPALNSQTIQNDPLLTLYENIPIIADSEKNHTSSALPFVETKTFIQEPTEPDTVEIFPEVQNPPNSPQQQIAQFKPCIEDLVSLLQLGGQDQVTVYDWTDSFEKNRVLVNSEETYETVALHDLHLDFIDRCFYQLYGEASQYITVGDRERFVAELQLLLQNDMELGILANPATLASKQHALFLQFPVYKRVEQSKEVFEMKVNETILTKQLEKVMQWGQFTYMSKYGYGVTRKTVQEDQEKRDTKYMTDGKLQHTAAVIEQQTRFPQLSVEEATQWVETQRQLDQAKARTRRVKATKKLLKPIHQLPSRYQSKKLTTIPDQIQPQVVESIYVSTVKNDGTKEEAYQKLVLDENLLPNVFTFDDAHEEDDADASGTGLSANAVPAVPIRQNMTDKVKSSPFEIKHHVLDYSTHLFPGNVHLQNQRGSVTGGSDQFLRKHYSGIHTPVLSRIHSGNNLRKNANMNLPIPKLLEQVWVRNGEQHEAVQIDMIWQKAIQNAIEQSLAYGNEHRSLVDPSTTQETTLGLAVNGAWVKPTPDAGLTTPKSIAGEYIGSVYSDSEDNLSEEEDQVPLLLNNDNLHNRNKTQNAANVTNLNVHVPNEEEHISQEKPSIPFTPTFYKTESTIQQPKQKTILRRFLKGVYIGPVDYGITNEAYEDEVVVMDDDVHTEVESKSIEVVIGTGGNAELVEEDEMGDQEINLHSSYSKVHNARRIDKASASVQNQSLQNLSKHVGLVRRNMQRDEQGYFDGIEIDTRHTVKSLDPKTQTIKANEYYHSQRNSTQHKLYISDLQLASLKYAPMNELQEARGQKNYTKQEKQDTKQLKTARKLATNRTTTLPKDEFTSNTATIETIHIVKKEPDQPHLSMYIPPNTKQPSAVDNVKQFITIQENRNIAHRMNTYILPRQHTQQQQQQSIISPENILLKKKQLSSHMYHNK